MSIIDFLTIHKTFIVDSICFWWSQVRYNASSNTGADREKMEYSLLRETHTIEKGLSLQNPRVGFGQQKVKVLMVHLAEFQLRFGNQNPAFFDYPLSVIQFWINYTCHQGIRIDALVSQFESLCRQCGKEHVCGRAGVTEVSRHQIQQSAAGSFSSLVQSRHSVRYFLPQPVDHSLIDQALQMAQLTPSACNRQGWKTHVFEGEACHRLLQWQGGSRGFEDVVHHAILVTSNQKAFFHYEMHQAYVDGGLYAMNLINALHSLGLGTIPLSCGFKQRKLRRLHAQFDIPPEQLPIIIIGFGHLPEQFKVAISERKDIALTNTYHTES